ncbi:MAG: transglycosylase domain-containing protein [Clostridia bacterium]|nr:transglycosylase domain-containing protein [Clostridia bacterium]
MKKLLKTTLILVICAAILFSVGFGVLAAFSSTVALDTSLLPVAVAEPVFYSSNGEKMNYEGSSALEPEEIPNNLKNAFIALEDKRFYSHHGYDLTRIAGAIIKNLQAGKTKEGASTITQQLIKNTHLTSEKTMRRKINEVFLATKLEKQYTKDEILAMYLSVIYFGGGIYGVRDAANYYFSKELSELTVAECATLAGIVKNPSAYSPKNNLENSTNRRNLVLKLMNEQGMIDSDTLETSLDEKTKVTTNEEIITGEKSYIKQCIREILEKLNITRFQLENSGLVIHTHYNENAQNLLVRELLNKSNYSEENLEGAGALIDNETRGVLAYYSTIPYAFRRQAGSVIKPLVAYAPALEKGLITIASPINDELTDFGGYTPSNYNGAYYGWTTPREAIKKSMNTVAVKALSYVGSDVGMEYGRKFGLPLDNSDNSLALALGGLTNGVTVLEMAGAYTTLANEGIYSAPTFIRYIEKNNGDIISSGKNIEIQTISKENSAILTNVLIDTAQSGTARTLSTLPFQVASKTGTVGFSSSTNADKPNTDAWNLSYTTAHTLAIWHGGIPTSETGGGNTTMSARKIWNSLYTEKNANINYSSGIIANRMTSSKNFEYPADFRLPETVMEIEIDDYALKNEQRVLLASEITPQEYRKKELFAVSNMPMEISDIFTKVEVENLNVEIISETENNTPDSTNNNASDNNDNKNISNGHKNSDDKDKNPKNNNKHDKERGDNKNEKEKHDDKNQDFDNESNIDNDESEEDDDEESFYRLNNKESFYTFYNKSFSSLKKNLPKKDNSSSIKINLIASKNIDYEPENDFGYTLKNVKISFDAKEIFCYRIEREINGNSIVISEIKNQKGNIVIVDTPFIFEGFVTYKVTPILYCDDEIIEGASSSQTVWVTNKLILSQFNESQHFYNPKLIA